MMASGADIPDTMEVDGDSSTVSEDSKSTATGQFGDIANGTLVECDTRIKRQIKKDDSGISVEKSENSSEEDGSKKPKTVESQDHVQSEGDCQPTSSDKDGSVFVKKSKSKNRNYRNKKSELSVSTDEDDNTVRKESTVLTEGRNSPDSGHQENSSNVVEVDMDESRDNEENAGTTDDNTRERTRRSESEETNDSADTEDRRSESIVSDEEEEVTPSVLLKPKPKHKWFVMQEVFSRERGVSNRLQGPELFQQRCYGSLHAVQRLELMYKLDAHHGCVNALHFNSSGTLLASGSDDLSVVIWDWPLGKYLVNYSSGHRSNVFQVKFLPLTGDSHVATCGRDGQIRLGELSQTGVCRQTRRLTQHKGPAHKLALLPDTPHVFLSSGEDGVVINVDVRQPKHDKLVHVNNDGRSIALYSIHSNPLNTNEFCVSGRHNYIKIYDRRKVSENQELKRFCPRHLTSSSSSAHVTCAVFNYNGTEIMGSYNDEDIYLFDTKHTEGLDYVHKYEGHRNSATVKGLSFFGPRSEFIVSGSDCGNIYFWEKSTESIVQWMPADENGVVNCLEPHPQIPVIATSGLDDDVKIWVPSCENEPVMEGLKAAVISNRKARDHDSQRDPESFDSQMLWILWRHIRRTERRRNQQGSGEGRRSPLFRSRRPSRQRNLADESSSSDSSNSSDNDDSEQRIQCSPS